ncbi:MAG: hypothetical protein IPN19_11710 [Elusimicrobia bacterium]|nr:hypothetical protein [Elusimicrobiota bacterium]
MRKNAGNMLAVFLGILVLATVFLPLVIQLLQTESNQSVNYQKSTLAFQLAEAAVAKGVAKLTETRKNWTDAAAGIPITRFNNDTAFTDVAGGTYKVQFLRGAVAGTVLIIGKGRDTSTKEVRVIEAEYSSVDPDTTALILNAGMSVGNPRLEVHWGSIKSYGNCSYGVLHPYPRIFSSGQTFRDTNSAPPNTNNVDHWSFQSDLGLPPVPDFAYYKQKAMNSVVPDVSPNGKILRFDGTPPIRNPANSGYFQSSLNVGNSVTFDKNAILPDGMGNQYEFRSSTSVLYFDIKAADFSSVSIKRAFLEVEAVIVDADSPGGGSLVNSVVPFNVFAATIPVAAPLDYKGTKQITYCDGSTKSGQDIWNWKFSATYAQPNHCCTNINNVQIHGYYYSHRVGWGLGTVVGVVHVGQANPTFSTVLTESQIYYDPNVFANVVWSRIPIYRISWKESTRSW